MTNNKKDKISRKEVEAQIKELAILIQETPKYKQVKTVMGKGSVEDTTPDTLRDMLNFLRVSIKYQLFDLNAYCVEVEWLRKICKDNKIDV